MKVELIEEKISLEASLNSFKTLFNSTMEIIVFMTKVFVLM